MHMLLWSSFRNGGVMWRVGLLLPLNCFYIARCCAVAERSSSASEDAGLHGMGLLQASSLNNKTNENNIRPSHGVAWYRFLYGNVVSHPCNWKFFFYKPKCKLRKKKAMIRAGIRNAVWAAAVLWGRCPVHGPGLFSLSTQTRNVSDRL